MRINEKTYPTYNYLERGDYVNLPIDSMFKDIMPKVEDAFLFLDGIKKTYLQVDKKYYLTDTFEQAILTAMPKIKDKNSHVNNIPSDCGIIFTDKGFSIYLSNPSDKLMKLVVYGFTKTDLTTFAYMDSEGKVGGLACAIKNGGEYNDTEALHEYIHSFLVAIYFIHNCEIEQKVLTPKNKLKINSTKYLNESSSDITILDCRWFTELIRNIPFNVKGHYRWQAHGLNFSKRKLKWISDFEKKGYHRNATKESILN
jgi:hypothetical protein